MVALKSTKLVFVGAAALIAAASVPAFGSHAPETQEAPLAGGGLRKHESFGKSWYIYNSIGGETKVFGKEKKRKWWCVFLCKRRVSKNAETITVLNTYYHEIQPGVFASTQEFKTCTNASSCTVRKWSAGAFIEIEFDTAGGGVGDPVGGGALGKLEIQGVVTSHEVTIDGETFSATTARGKHPAPVIL